VLICLWFTEQILSLGPNGTLLMPSSFMDFIDLSELEDPPHQASRAAIRKACKRQGVELSSLDGYKTDLSSIKVFPASHWHYQS